MRRVRELVGREEKRFNLVGISLKMGIVPFSPAQRETQGEPLHLAPSRYSLAVKVGEEEDLPRRLTFPTARDGIGIVFCFLLSPSLILI